MKKMKYMMQIIPKNRKLTKKLQFPKIEMFLVSVISARLIMRQLMKFGTSVLLNTISIIPTALCSLYLLTLETRDPPP